MSPAALPPQNTISNCAPIVIIGGGFAGIAAARALKKCQCKIILIDRRNHHIFQPLLYQVATAVLAPAEIASPIRQLAAEQKNVSVIMGEVTGVDRKEKTVDVHVLGVGLKKLAFSYLVVAPGVRPSYFGHDEFATYAPALKTISDAEAIRAKVLTAYERAEMSDDLDERSRLMTFVLVGAGPTGVELAASIAQMAKVTLRDNFRRIDPTMTSIILLDAAPRVLPTFSEGLARKAAERLAQLGVKIVVGAKVEHVDEQGVIIGDKRIASATVLWTAGVSPSPIVKMLETKTDRAGRACVEAALHIPEDKDVFVVGDAALVMRNGRPVPGVAQAAIQQGRYVGRLIAARLRGDQRPGPFSYFDKGNMAVVGKNFAILERGRIQMSGLFVWFVWAMIHVVFLPQLQNRLRVQTQWLWSYCTGQRSSRVIPETSASTAVIGGSLSMDAQLKPVEPPKLVPLARAG